MYDAGGVQLSLSTQGLILAVTFSVLFDPVNFIARVGEYPDTEDLWFDGNGNNELGVLITRDARINDKKLAHVVQRRARSRGQKTTRKAKTSDAR